MNTNFSEELFNGLVKGGDLEKAVPYSYRVSREFELVRNELEGGLIKKLVGGEVKATSIDLNSRNLSTTLIKQVNYALQQILYNQSYQTGNLEDYTGLSQKGKLAGEEGNSISPLEYKGESYNYAEIIVPLNQIASIAFGTDTPTNKQKKDAMAVLKFLQNEGITINYDNNAESKKKLIWIKEEVRLGNKKELYLDIVLTPLYSINLKDNYGLLPQNVIKLIGRVSSEKLTLISLLAIQDKGKPYRISESSLIEKLGLTDYWKKNKKRARTKLEGILDDLLRAGQIKGKIEEDEITRRGWKWDNEFLVIEIDSSFTKRDDN